MASQRTSPVERDFAAALKVAKRLPGIESDTCHGTPAIRVKGKFMGRLRTEAEGWLAIKCDFADREILLQAAPHVFHLTPHYRNYPMILVDLAASDVARRRRRSRQPPEGSRRSHAPPGNVSPHSGQGETRAEVT